METIKLYSESETKDFVVVPMTFVELHKALISLEEQPSLLIAEYMVRLNHICMDNFGQADDDSKYFIKYAVQDYLDFGAEQVYVEGQEGPEQRGIYLD